MRAVRQRVATLGHRAPENRSKVVCCVAIHNLSNLLELGHQTERFRTQFEALLPSSLVASLLQALLNPTATRHAMQKTLQYSVLPAPPAGIEPATFGLGSDHDELARVSSELQAVGIVRDGTREGVLRLQGLAGIGSRLVTTLLQPSSGLSSNLQREGTINSEERVLSREARLLTLRYGKWPQLCVCARQRCTT